MSEPTDMLHSDTDIQHDALDDMISGAQFTADEQPLPDEPSGYDEFLTADLPQLDEPDPSLIEPRRRTPAAKKYERKVAGLFSLSVKVTASQEHLLADSAALLLHGPDISAKMGDLAAQNARVARAIDMITDQTENAAVAVIMASAPLVLQIVRNHEPVMEKRNTKQPRMLRIPFTKRVIRFRIGWRLSKRMQALTQDPVVLQRHVFNNDAVREALARQGIIVRVG